MSMPQAVTPGGIPWERVGRLALFAAFCAAAAIGIGVSSDIPIRWYVTGIVAGLVSALVTVAKGSDWLMRPSPAVQRLGFMTAVGLGLLAKLFVPKGMMVAALTTFAIIVAGSAVETLGVHRTRRRDNLEP